MSWQCFHLLIEANTFWGCFRIVEDLKMWSGISEGFSESGAYRPKIAKSNSEIWMAEHSMRIKILIQLQKMLETECLDISLSVHFRKKTIITALKMSTFETFSKWPISCWYKVVIGLTFQRDRMIRHITLCALQKTIISALMLSTFETFRETRCFFLFSKWLSFPEGLLLNCKALF